MSLQDCKKEGEQIRERKTKQIHCKLSELSHTSVSHNGDVTSKHSDCFTELSRQFRKFLCQLLATNVPLSQGSRKTGIPTIRIHISIYLYTYIPIDTYISIFLSKLDVFHDNVWGCLLACESGESMPKTPSDDGSQT